LDFVRYADLLRCPDRYLHNSITSFLFVKGKALEKSRAFLFYQKYSYLCYAMYDLITRIKTFRQRTTPSEAYIANVLSGGFLFSPP
jgi:hypothetical protein